MHNQIEKSTNEMNKVARYGWVKKDSPGCFEMLSKTILQMAEEYQRHVVPSKIVLITKAWSWISCGAIIVAYRDGVYWVVDGQHRVLSAMRRSDIDKLPCLVFETSSIITEARAFLDVNTLRRPVTAIDQLKAKATTNDAESMFVVRAIEDAGLEIRTYARAVNQIKCVGICQRLAQEDRAAFVSALNLLAALCRIENTPILERPLSALHYLDRNISGGLSNKRLRERINAIGAQVLLVASNKAAAFYARGGAKVWATGVLESINKGMRNRFVFVRDES